MFKFLIIKEQLCWNCDNVTSWILWTLVPHNTTGCSIWEEIMRQDGYHTEFIFTHEVWYDKFSTEQEIISYSSVPHYSLKYSAMLVSIQATIWIRSYSNIKLLKRLEPLQCYLYERLGVLSMFYGFLVYHKS